MRVSQFPLSTQKEVPADAEIISHQLMLRAGLIRKVASGLYTWKPWGLKILRKVEEIVRDEMNKAGAIEVLMPTLQPAELWHESGRWEKFGPQLLSFKDRHERDFCYGPTHEEVITDYVRNEIQSYKQLPTNFYQIQSKVRDEIRPRFGVMRAREFLMKDAYSFHMDQQSLEQTYQDMHTAYSNIFTRLGLTFRAVEADSGAIGGSGSHEFHVLAESGEDAIAYSTESEYAANIEKAVAVSNEPAQSPSGRSREKVATPGVKSIEEVSQKLDIPANQCLKTLLVAGSEEDTVIALLLRGDHQLNEVKAANHPLIKMPFSMATEKQIKSAANCEPGSLGPIGLKVKILADEAAAKLADFVCGANEDGFHYTNANFDNELENIETADLRNIQVGDPSPDGKGTLEIMRGIEVGHIFQLGDQYSQAMKCQVLDENGKARILTMGCYGIGVSRIVAAAIEQNNDERGIIWPSAITPFAVVIAPINLHKSQRLAEAVDTLYQELLDAGIDVLLDDRKARPGVMFADQELLGLPHRIVFSEKGLDAGEIEYKARTAKDSENFPLKDAVSFIQKKLEQTA